MAELVKGLATISKDGGTGNDTLVADKVVAGIRQDDSLFIAELS